LTAVPTLRIARPSNDLAALRAFYVEGAGFDVLAEFADHDGFDGLIVGYPDAPWHLEFTRQVGIVAPDAPTPEHLLVLYLPDLAAWQAAVERMRRFGASPVPAHNPYWDQSGATFSDPDGYRLVFQNASWSA
jgi:hypothetical protein